MNFAITISTYLCQRAGNAVIYSHIPVTHHAPFAGKGPVVHGSTSPHELLIRAMDNFLA